MTVITIGELVVDWIATKKGIGWNQSETFLRSSGGNAANVAQALCRLGTKARLVAKVGDDIHAGYLLEALVAAGVETRFVSQTSAFATAQCYVLTDAAEENQFFNWPKPNACHQLTVDDLPQDLFDKAVALHATGISLTVEPRSSAVIEAMSRGKNNGLLISFDAGFPTGEGDKARKLAHQAMALAHVIKVNLPELYFWLADFDSLEGAKVERNLTDNIETLTAYGQLLRQRTGAEIILLTLGAGGSIIVSAAQSCFAAPIKVKSLAGVGAGDAYVAAVLNQIAEGQNSFTEEHDWQSRLNLDWPAIARFANAAGALATRTISASQGLPSLEEVKALVRQ